MADIYGTAGDDLRNGTNGDDEIWGGPSDQMSSGIPELGDDTLHGRGGDDRIFGFDGDNSLTGGAGRDVISAGAGNNFLDGGADNDQLRFGFSRFADGRGDNTVSGGDGDDLLEASEPLSRARGNDLISGGSGDDIIIATTAGDDTVSGGTGADSIRIFLGVDFIDAGDDDDVLFFSNHDGGDVLDGGAGVDSIDALSLGGPLTIDLRITTGQQLRAGAALDVVRNFENVTGTIEDDRITGNALANILRGNDFGADTIDGGGGDDALYGNVDSGFERPELADTASYLSADRGVTVSLALQGAYQQTNGAGRDLLQDFENLWGSNYRDRLTGDAGDNRLEGKIGYDTLIGGSGDDTYVLDSIGDPNAADPPVDPARAAAPGFAYDQVIEAANGGVDTVIVSPTARTSYALADNVENGVVVGTAAFSLVGNARGNSLTGNQGANTLDGRAGVDTMTGRGGDDVYHVDRGADVVVEAAGVANGRDLVISSAVSYALAANVERLTLADGAVTGHGNISANTMTGNAAANSLNGLEGADTIDGGAGDDSINGGSGADALTGGDGDDRLIAGAGGDPRTSTGDRLYGGAGRDTLYGQAGADLFVYASTGDSDTNAKGADIIADFSRTEGDRVGLDRIDANSGVAGDQAFRFVGTTGFQRAGDLNYEIVDGYAVVSGDIDGDAVADFAIRLAGVTTLAAGDFIL